MGGRLFTDKLVFGGWKFTAFGRLTVPPHPLLLAPPTLVARPEASKPLIRFVAVCSFYLSCSFFNRYQKN